MSAENKNKKNNIAGKIVAGVISGLAITTFLASSTIVPAGHTGVQVVLGKVSNDTFPEGFHLKTPFITHVIDVSNK